MNRKKNGRFARAGHFDKYKKISEKLKAWGKREEYAVFDPDCDHSYSESNVPIRPVSVDANLSSLDDYRCIVEIGALVRHMRKCKFCPVPLRLCHSKGVFHSGLGGWLHVQCENCMEVNKIPLSKQHHREGDNRGRSVFDVNTKLATAMIHSGIGYTQVQHFLTTINLHGISHTALKDRENEIGPIMEKFAGESVDRALQQEAFGITLDAYHGDQELQIQEKVNIPEAVEECQGSISDAGDGTGESTNNLSQEITEEFQGSLSDKVENMENANEFSQEIAEKPQEQTDNGNITASADAAWQRRGAGRSYNSLSGVSTLIGSKTGKTLAFSIRSKRCKMCSIAKRLKKNPKKHVCRMNWKGSAKSMEGSMLLQMLENVKDRGANVTTVIGDNDSTSLKMVREQFNKDIEKFDDKNHLYKNISGRLFAIKSQFKELSPKTIDAIMKNFRYMIEQNQGNPEGICVGLRAVVNHLFGIHSDCESKWCGFLQDEDNYKHKNLPYGKDLKDTNLKQKLEEIFIEKLTKSSKSLANLSSTQRNESFNSTLASKAPKAKHYSESSSLTYRVCASVSQKNEGYSYVPQVHAKAGLSPGTATVKRSTLMDRHTAKRRLTFTTKEYRKRRMELKSQRKVIESCCELREGDTYKTSIGLDEEEADTVPIPAPTTTITPEEKRPTDTPLVVFDLETTGLSRTSDIIQISARCGQECFSTYVTPSSFISKGASEVTGITLRNSQLYYNGVLVESLPPQLALIKFCEYLEKFDRPILVAHNAKTFDSKILMNQLKSFHLWSHFKSLILGFADSLEVFKDSFRNQVSYKQSDLARSILNETYEAHNASEDVKVLQKLVALVPKQLFSDKLFQPLDTSSFSNILSSKVLTMQMVKKILTSGLTLQHLQTAYRRAGTAGLKLILCEPIDGKPRVTRSKVIVNKLSEYFENMKENI